MTVVMMRQMRCRSSQPSCLGPLLFLIYIDDILDIFQPLVKGKCILMNDDVKLCTELKTSTDEVCFHNYLDLLHEWSEIWRVISSKKCCVVTIGNGKPHDNHDRFQYYLDAEYITNSDAVSDLGVTVDSQIQVRYCKGPLSQKSAGHMQNRKTKTNTNPIVLTLTDTGGAVLTLMLGYRSLYITWQQRLLRQRTVTDSHLCFSDHIVKITRKAHQRANLIHRCFTVLLNSVIHWLRPSLRMFVLCYKQ